jgi:hypothetical protein
MANRRPRAEPLLGGNDRNGVPRQSVSHRGRVLMGLTVRSARPTWSFANENVRARDSR